MSWRVTHVTRATKFVPTILDFSGCRTCFHLPIDHQSIPLPQPRASSYVQPRYLSSNEAQSYCKGASRWFERWENNIHIWICYSDTSIKTNQRSPKPNITLSNNHSPLSAPLTPRLPPDIPPDIPPAPPTHPPSSPEPIDTPSTAPRTFPPPHAPVQLGYDYVDLLLLPVFLSYNLLVLGVRLRHPSIGQSIVTQLIELGQSLLVHLFEGLDIQVFVFVGNSGALASQLR